jgi:hypothetical protein
MTSHDASQEGPKREKPNQPKEQRMKSLAFFKPTLATTLAIVLAWLLSVRPAASLATLGVTPGSYLWNWGTGANQNFTLRIKTPLYNAVTSQTAIWYLNNGTFMGSAFAPTLPANWRVVGVADFNGDGKPDYLLYNVSTGQTAVWYLNNNVFIGSAFGPTLPANWNVVGVADFDADGRPDYLLFNSTSHQTAIWYLSGTTFVSGAFGPSLPIGWDLVAAGDFNADGKPDYMLYSPATRQTAIWLSQ